MGLSVEMEQSAEEWSEIKGLVLCVNGWNERHKVVIIPSDHFF